MTWLPAPHAARAEVKVNKSYNIKDNVFSDLYTYATIHAIFILGIGFEIS